MMQTSLYDRTFFPGQKVKMLDPKFSERTFTIERFVQPSTDRPGGRLGLIDDRGCRYVSHPDDVEPARTWG